MNSFASTLPTDSVFVCKYDELVNSLDYDIEYQRAKDGISDLPISQKTLDSFDATVSDEVGNITKLNVYATVKKLGSITYSEETENVYSLTVFASDKTDSGSEHYSSTTAYGNLIWTDNYGPDNNLVQVNGGWSTSGDQISNRIVEYGLNPYGTVRHPSGNSFTYSGTSDMTGLLLFLETNADVNGNNLRLRILNSPFT